LRAIYLDALQRAQRDGSLTREVDAEILVRIVQAVADGMQLQWMLDPEVDMAATIAAVFTLLGTQRSGATDA
jgi:hypothetical protein